MPLMQLSEPLRLHYLKVDTAHISHSQAWVQSRLIADCGFEKGWADISAHTARCLDGSNALQV